MTEHWTGKYIGIPFVPGGRDMDGCDCGGLVLLVLRQEKGVLASDFNAYLPENFRHASGMAGLGEGITDLVRREWPKVEAPRPFDLARFLVGRHPAHVGVYAGDGLFLHVDDSGFCARLTELQDLSWVPRLYDFRRHKAVLEESA